MRLLIIFFFLGICTWGFSNDKAIINPTHTIVTIPLKASQFLKLSAKEYGILTGKKIKFRDRVAFTMLKMRMRHDLKRNPDLLITDYLAPDKSDKFRLNGLWFALGLFLGPIAVIAAYVSKQEKNKITSSWIGFGAMVIFYIILLLIFIAAISSAFRSCDYPM